MEAPGQLPSLPSPKSGAGSHARTLARSHARTVTTQAVLYTGRQCNVPFVELEWAPCQYGLIIAMCGCRIGV